MQTNHAKIVQRMRASDDCLREFWQRDPTEILVDSGLEVGKLVLRAFREAHVSVSSGFVAVKQFILE